MRRISASPASSNIRAIQPWRDVMNRLYRPLLTSPIMPSPIKITKQRSTAPVNSNIRAIPPWKEVMNRLYRPSLHKQEHGKVRRENIRKSAVSNQRKPMNGIIYNTRGTSQSPTPEIRKKYVIPPVRQRNGVPPVKL